LPLLFDDAYAASVRAAVVVSDYVPDVAAWLQRGRVALYLGVVNEEVLSGWPHQEAVAFFGVKPLDPALLSVSFGGFESGRRPVDWSLLGGRGVRDILDCESGRLQACTSIYSLLLALLLASTR
jgi:hypothetical protein